jgi:hypothetical protein
MPFEFGAGGTEFPKGDCNIDISRASKVSISCSRSRAVVQASTLPFAGSVYDVADRKEVILTRYGDTYFLSRVWIAHEGREISRSDEENELRSDGVEGVPVKLKIK